MHDEELPKLYASPNIVKVMKSRKIRQGHVACMGRKWNLIGKPKVKRPLGRIRDGLEDNIEKDFRVIGWAVVN